MVLPELWFCVCSHGRRLSEHQTKPGQDSRLEQLLTPPPVPREDFVNLKLASKLAQQLKVAPLLISMLALVQRVCSGCSLECLQLCGREAAEALAHAASHQR